MVDNISKIWGFFSDFFKNLTDFFYHLIIPTDSQWQEIGEDYQDIGETVGRHIPFVGLFSEELKKAQDTVEKTDFLVIEIPEFSYSAGVIGVTTEKNKVVNVAEIYEPYRAYVRGGLFLIVVGLGFVYIVKYVLNFGQASASADFYKDIRKR